MGYVSYYSFSIKLTNLQMCVSSQTPKQRNKTVTTIQTRHRPPQFQLVFFEVSHRLYNGVLSHLSAEVTPDLTVEKSKKQFPQFV